MVQKIGKDKKIYYDGKSHDRGGQEISIRSFGAINDAAQGTCSITGSTVTVGSSLFLPSDVGKVIYIYSAGSNGGMHKTSISAYTNATTVSVTNAAIANQSNVTFYYGTDNTNAIQAAIDYCDSNGGGIISGESGNYIVTSIQLKKKITFRGTGIDSFNLWSAISTGEVVQSFWTINSSTGVYIKLQSMTIKVIDPRNTATCFADVCGTYVSLYQVRVTGGIFGIVFDQSELSEVSECVIETDWAYHFGAINGYEVPTESSYGWVKTGSASVAVNGRIYINTLTTNTATHFKRDLSAEAFVRGFTVLLSPPEVVSSTGSSLPNDSIIVRIDNGTNQRFDLRFTSTGVAINGGTVRSCILSDIIRLEIAVGGATANLHVSGVKTDSNVTALASANTAGVYFGDMATTDDSNVGWKYLEYFSCNPIPIGFWAVSGDHFWKSRQSYNYTGSITSGTSTLILTTGMFTTDDVGKSIVVVGAGVSGANLSTTISAFLSSSQVTLAANASTSVTNNTVTFNPSSASEFTNRITVSKTQFNTNAWQLVDDGGYVHTFSDNNHNGGYHQVYVASGINVDIRTNEHEAAIASCLTLKSVQAQGSSYKGSNVSVRIANSLFTSPIYKANEIMYVLNAHSVTIDDNYFAKGNVIFQASITSGTSTLTVNNVTFNQNDVGKVATVVGAGVSGGALTGTIMKILATNQVKLSTNASTTVSLSNTTFSPEIHANHVIFLDHTGAVGKLSHKGNHTSGAELFNDVTQDYPYVTGTFSDTYNDNYSFRAKDKVAIVLPRIATQITSDQNDYNPLGTSHSSLNSSLLCLSSDATRNITGLLKGLDGQKLTILNNGSFNVVLKHQSSSSATQNRFLSSSGLDAVILPNRSVNLIYLAETGFWHIESTNETSVVKGTITVNPDSVAANSTSLQTVTLTGAAVGDSITLNPSSAGLSAGLAILQCYISAANTISILYWNSTGSSIDQASSTWTYTLTR